MAKNIYGPSIAKNIYGPPMAKNIYGPHIDKSQISYFVSTFDFE